MPSRQRAYQITHTENGLCQHCPDVAVINGYCARHRRAHNALRTTDAYRAKRRTRDAAKRLWARPWTVFGLKRPYTAEDVRRALRQYVSKFKLHTDVGGNKVTLQRFNQLAAKAIAAIEEK